MNSIRINGLTICGGRNVVIENGRVTVDGKVVTGKESEGPTIHIEITGNVESLSVDACESLTVQGSAGSVKTLSGDVRCGDVAGGVQTMSGDVRCGAVSGSVSTMSGDILRR